MQKIILAVLCCVASFSALAQSESSYIDDRSSPESVVSSFYNAIDRGEYVRAYSYYGGAGASMDFAAFVKRVSGFGAIHLVLGKATAEGAAGSIYYTLPVMVETAGAQGASGKTYTGCYLLRLANPQIQAEPPFQPMHIEREEMRPARHGGQARLPEECRF